MGKVFAASIGGDGTIPVNSVQVLRGISTAANQQPTAVDTAKQVEFGAAQLTGSDPVSLAANGTVTVNEAGSYFALVVFQFGRTGSSGTSNLYGRVLVNGTQVLNSVHAKVSSADVVTPVQLDLRFIDVPAGATITFEIIRDSSGNNSGGLFGADPTAAGWADAPSASITMFKLETG